MSAKCISIELVASLPTELWIRILEIAARPTIIIGDETCPPDMIEICVRMRTSNVTADAARRLFKANKKRFSAVCQLWEQICDRIHEEMWVRDLSNMDASQRGGPVEVGVNHHIQGIIPRVNVLHCGAAPVRIKHTLPVSSLTLLVATNTSRNEYAWLDGLSSIIKHPSYLNSLHLTLDAFRNLPDLLLESLASPNVPLLTLSLKTSRFGLFHLSLTFPHLTTLSLHFLSAGRSGQCPPPSSWNLPSLINLSLGFGSSINGMPIAGFISRLLEHHSRRLRSLRLEETQLAGIETICPLIWSSLPRLEVLATDFALLLQAGTLNRRLTEQAVEASLREVWSAHLAVRHLVHNGYSLPSVFIPGLKCAINNCFKLDSVSLVPPIRLSASYWKLPAVESTALADLEALCTSRGVRILDKDGYEFTDITKV